MKTQNFNIENLSNEEQELLLQKLQQNKMIRMEKEILLLKEQVIKREIQINERFDEVQEGIEKVINKTSRIENKISSEDYLNRENLGQKLCNPTISSHRATKILRIIGILKESSVIPKMQYTDGNNPIALKYKFIRNSGYEDFNYKYNVEKIKEKWERYLRDNNLYNDFYSCETKQEVDNFIDNLYDDISI